MFSVLASETPTGFTSRPDSDFDEPDPVPCVEKARRQVPLPPLPPLPPSSCASHQSSVAAVAIWPLSQAFLLCLSTVACMSVAATPVQWETSINEELLAIGQEREQPMIRRRESSDDKDKNKEKDKDKDKEKTNENGGDGGNEDADEASRAPLRFLYDHEDLLEAIIHVRA